MRARRRKGGERTLRVAPKPRLSPAGSRLKRPKGAVREFETAPERTDSSHIPAGTLAASCCVLHAIHRGHETPDVPDVPDGPGWLSWRDASDYLDVSKSEFFRLARRGDFPRPRMWGGRRRWRRVDLDSWAEAQEPVAATT